MNIIKKIHIGNTIKKGFHHIYGLARKDRFEIRTNLNKAVVKELLKFDDLEIIQFSNFLPNIKTFENLNNILFKHRKDITLRAYYRTNIDFLEHLDELEKFEWDADIFTDISPLYKIKNLVHFSIGFAKEQHKQSLQFLNEFSHSLESLSLKGNFEDIKVISNLRRLKYLWIAANKFDKLELIEQLPIESFGYFGSKIKDFNLLTKIQTLRNIKIKGNRNLDDISFISKLKNLETIELLYNPKIKEFPKCNNLTKLKYINIFECNRLEDIYKLEKISNCKIKVTGNQLRKLKKQMWVNI